MKKAKQILSLMLVIAMALGMMVFVPGTASAKNVGDYPDADDIEYKEAVDVLSALGVLLGDDTGAFNPQGDITREQAAKIITYILIGTTAADRLAHRESSFTDVATDRWSNPFIEYCVEKGIIKGYGDGRFGPADPVTASQMAKMLLICIGYGAVGEYDNPDSWELNTIVDGQKRGILTLDNDFTKPASREEVALYTFNTLTDEDNAFLVIYSELAKQYLTAGSSIITQQSATTLGAETFRLFEASRVDPLGYSVRTWKLNSPNNADSLTASYRKDATIYKGTDGSYLTGIASNMTTLSLTTSGSMYFKGEMRTYLNADDELVGIKVYLNGTEVTSGAYNYGGTGGYALDGGGYASPAAASAATVLGFDGTTPISIDDLCYIKGITVELVDRNGDGYIDKVLLTRKSVATVLANPSTDAFMTTTIPGVKASLPTGLTDAYSYGTVDYPADLKAGDIVLYFTYVTPTGYMTKIEKAASVSGTFTAFNRAGNAAMDSATLSGTQYYVSGLPNTNVASPYEKFYSFTSVVSNFNTEVTAYLDDGKNIIGFVPGEEADLNYLVVVSTPMTLGHAAQVEVIMANGTYAVIDVATYVNSSGVATSSSVASYLAANTIYSYTLDFNGKYTLTYEPNIKAVATGIQSAANFAGVGHVANESTVFVIYDSNTTTYKVYNGVKNVPNVSSLATLDGTNTVVMAKGSYFAEFVYVQGVSSTVSTNMLFFPNITTYGLGSVDNDGQKYYTLTAINPETGASEIKTLTSAAYKNLLNNSSICSAYVDVGYGSGDIITSVNVAPMSVPVLGNYTVGMGITAAAKNGTISLGGGAYRYDANTKVYSINMLFGSASMASIDGFAADSSVYFFAKLSKESNFSDLITEIYIIPSDQVIWVYMYPVTSAVATPPATPITASKVGGTTQAAVETAIVSGTTIVFEYAGGIDVSAPLTYGTDWFVLGYYDTNKLEMGAPAGTPVSIFDAGTGTVDAATANGVYYAQVGFSIPGVYTATYGMIPVTITA